MKKFLFFAFFGLNAFLYAECIPYSSLGEDGFPSAYSELAQKINQKVEMLNQKYKSDIQEMVKEIEKETQEKEKNINILKALEKELSLSQMEIDFILKQELEILSNHANIEAVR